MKRDVSDGAGARSLGAQVLNPLFGRLSRDVRLWLIGLAVMFGAAAVAAAMVWQGEQATGRERAAHQRYEHTLEVLAEIESFSTALSEAQRGARGYLLTHDPRFLATWRRGHDDAPGRLADLGRLTADNPSQQQRLRGLSTAAAAVLDLDAREVGLEAAGQHAAAVRLVGGAEAAAAMASVRAISGAVAAEERRLLSVRRDAAKAAMEQEASVTFGLAILGGGLFVIAGAMGWLALVSAARARVAEVHADTHQRVAMAANLLSLFIAETPASIAMFDRGMRYLAVSRRYVTDYRLPESVSLVGRSHYEVFPEITERWVDIHRRVLAGATEHCDADPFPRADGRVDWVRWQMNPWWDGSGHVGGAVLFSEVITDTIDSQRALGIAEARLRAMVEAAADAILTIDEKGTVQSANPATTTLFGYAADELIGHNINVLMPEPHRSAHDAYLAAYCATGRGRIIGVGREVEGLRKDGSTFPLDLAVTEWRVEGKRSFTGVMRDISSRKLAEAQRLQAERRELVVGELRHRISNMFTVINGLVVATARSQTDVAAYRDAIVDRITAFAITQLELARQGWADRDLRDLIMFELKPYADEGRRISIEGETVKVQGAAAESLAMTIHELATNAAKYGAFARPDGAVEVNWRRPQGADAASPLIVEWRERGGPPVSTPARKGFGSTVIESSARTLGGRAKLEFAPQGLVCTIEIPADRIAADGAPQAKTDGAAA